MLFSCSCGKETKQKPLATLTGKPAPPQQFDLYSGAVGDSFRIFIGLPDDYDPALIYPVVFLVDGNYYQPVMKEALKLYAAMGALPPVILVGIGYPDPETIEDNRTRDDTYPVAKANYEMTKSGGADKFLSFIGEELLPAIRKEYKIDDSNLILAGHSLGGYFVSYAFCRSLEGGSSPFAHFVAASPSLHYNDGYLLRRLTKARGANIKADFFICFGGDEDKEDEGDPEAIPVREMLAWVHTALRGQDTARVHYDSRLFCGLGHLDTPFPGILKGISVVLGKDN